MKRLGLIAMVALVILIAPVGGVADTLIPTHESIENFFSTGGTQVTCAIGCTSFNVGNTSGDILWEVVEKVFLDSTTQQTIFTYTVTNDNVSSPITSFAVFANGVSAPSSTAPSNWSFFQLSGFWIWFTNTSGAGISSGPPPTSLDSMSVTLPGAVPVTFSPTAIDTGSEHTILTGANWVASSPVPEPGTLALLGTGLASIAGLLRRKLTS